MFHYTCQVPLLSFHEMWCKFATWETQILNLEKAFLRWRICSLICVRNGVYCLTAIAGDTILVPYHVVKSLHLIWRSGTRRWNLPIPDLQISCNVLTSLQGTRMIVPVMSTRVTCPIRWWLYITDAESPPIDSNINCNIQCSAVIMSVFSKIFTIDTSYLNCLGGIWGVFYESKLWFR